MRMLMRSLVEVLVLPAPLLRGGDFFSPQLFFISIIRRHAVVLEVKIEVRSIWCPLSWTCIAGIVLVFSGMVCAKMRGKKKKTPQNIWYIDYFTAPSTEYTWPYWADIHAPWRGCRDAFTSINDLAPWCQEGHWQPQSLLFHLTHPPTCWHDHHGVQNLQPPSPSEPHRPISACFLLNTVADIYDSKQGGFILRGWWGLLSLFNLSPIKLSG